MNFVLCQGGEGAEELLRIRCGVMDLAFPGPQLPF